MCERRTLLPDAYGWRFICAMVAEMAHAHVEVGGVHNDTDERPPLGHDRLGRQLALACCLQAGLVPHSTQRQKGHLCFALSVLRSVSC